MRWVLYISLAYGMIFGGVALINAVGWGASAAYRAANPDAPIGIIVGAGVCALAAVSSGIISFVKRKSLPAIAVRLSYALGAIAFAAVASTVLVK